MANRKLSLPLFSAKTLVSQPGHSTHYLHFIATVSQRTDQRVLVCESQPLMTSRSHGLPARCPAQIHSRRTQMVVSKDNQGRPISWQETYFGKDETVNVSVVRNVTTISTRNKTSGKVESKTFLGTPLLPSDSDRSK